MHVLSACLIWFYILLLHPHAFDSTLASSQEEILLWGVGALDEIPFLGSSENSLSSEAQWASWHLP